MKLSAPLALALSLPSAAAFTSLCDPTSASNADYTTTFSDNFSGDTLDESSWTITEGYEVGQTRDSWGTAANVEVIHPFFLPQPTDPLSSPSSPTLLYAPPSGR